MVVALPWVVVQTFVVEVQEQALVQVCIEVDQVQVLEQGMVEELEQGMAVELEQVRIVEVLELELGQGMVEEQELDMELGMVEEQECKQVGRQYVRQGQVLELGTVEEQEQGFVELDLMELELVLGMV